MSLKDSIKTDLVAAMKRKDQVEVGCLRMVTADLKKREIDGGKELDESAIFGALSTLIKQRHESADAFRKGNRLDLAEKEEKEIQIIQRYLPTPFSAAELEELVKAAITEVGASSMADMGKVMGVAKSQAAGRADGKTLSECIKRLLSS